MGLLITLITLLPTIIKFILSINDLFKTIQTTLPAGTKLGAVKKQLLMDTVLLGTNDTKVHAAVSSIVDKSVTTLKTVGWDDPAQPATTEVII